MKHTLVRYGLISGGISAALMIGVTLIFHYIGFDKIGFDKSMYIGYGSILAAMSVVFFAVRTHREQNQGTITFGKGLLIGLGVTLISCVIYSLAWMVVYYNFIPTFIDDYSAYCIKKAESTGASKAELEATMTQLSQMKEWYKSPLMIFLLTLMEPLPVGVLISLISAGVLRRK
ncbi:MAG: DUF4199 domain-containing protein [Spirosomataceae bacterium]